MAGPFTSVMAVPGAATEAQTIRPGLNVSRYCKTRNCRNGIRLSTEDKLCEQCLEQNGPAYGFASASATEAAEGGRPQSQPPRVVLEGPLFQEAREDRDRQPAHPSSRHAAVKAQSDPHSAHLAMLDERQQNRARKLEQETEEVDGRWRTIQSATALLDSSPPRLSRPRLRSSSRSPSRRPETDRAVTVDAYRPNGRYRPHEIDAYRPGRSPSRDHRSDHIDRLHELNPLRLATPAMQPVAGHVQRLSRKRKLDIVTAGNDTSNKSLGNPSLSARCGKRKCNNMAITGKDRCKTCYSAEGRHPGDERRRCASSGCSHCISDTIKGDLCRTCLGIELGDIKLCSSTFRLCKNHLKPSNAGPLCTACRRIASLSAVPVRRCKSKGCNTVLPTNERGDLCKEHVPPPPIGRVCARSACKNQIAANIQGYLCRVCLEAKKGRDKNATAQPNKLKPHQGNLPAPSYQQYPYNVNYFALQQAQGQPYPQSFQALPFYDQSQRIANPMSFQEPPQRIVGPRSFQGQPQRMMSQLISQQPQRMMSPQAFQAQPQRTMGPPQVQGQPPQFQYHAQRLMMGQPHVQPHVLQQRPEEQIGYLRQFAGQPQQIEGHRSSFLTQQFGQASRPQPTSTPVHRAVPQTAASPLVFDDSDIPRGLPDSMQSLSDVSSSARRIRVTTMQQMLKAPCFGCYRQLGVDEASTHPQIYCVHLPSSVRQAVLEDDEQWKQMCISGQEAEDGEIDSEIDIPDTSGRGEAVAIKKEKQEEERPLQSLPPIGSQQSEKHRLSPVRESMYQDEPASPQTEHVIPAIELLEQVGRQHSSVALERQDHPKSPVYPAMAVPDRVDSAANSSDAAPPDQGDSGTAVGPLPENWAVDSIRELLELKAAAEPGTPLEVAVSLQQELRNCLLLDVTEGDPQDGEPSAIGLLHILDQEVESLRARPAGG